MSQTIYAIINTTNNKFYIGRTSEKLEARLSRHYRQRNAKDRKHRALPLAMRKLPLSAFIIIPLAVVDGDKARAIETATIQKFRANSPNDIYNIGNGDGHQGVGIPYAPINNLSSSLIASAQALYDSGEFFLSDISRIKKIPYHAVRRLIKR